ncbi:MULTISPECIES: hypothetical protein [Achromobacter]|nr:MULTISPECIES: hypothetical protein [Achromobacter]MCH1985489.1 hypothetical protein [Achromobacter xylosoxidans]MCH1994367.1 hypothetical protein [Achromobacter xylosoxidans]MCH4585158.1 hypothetical protein [Achromobacter xylosoxidans]
MNESIRKWFDWRGWTVMVSAVAIVLTVAAILSPAFRGLIADPATANWASAVGTAAAAGAAVWLGLREGAWRHQKNDIDEAIFTALCRPEAEALIRRLQAIKHVHDYVKMAGVGKASSILALETARVYGARPALVETRKYIAQFGALGAERAAALAQAVGSLDLLEEALKMSTHLDVNGDYQLASTGLDDSRRLIDRIQAALRKALRMNEDEYQHIIRGPIQAIAERSDRYRQLETEIKDMLAKGTIEP